MEEMEGGIYDPTRANNNNLSKIAEAANKKMRKLKTNFSLKKSDITRSLSRIRRTGGSGVGAGGSRQALAGDGYVVSGRIY